MAHKVFISYKKEDLQFKNQLVSLFSQKHVDVIDKSLNEIIPSNNLDYVMQILRRDYLSDSTVTIFLIGEHSSENEGYDLYGRTHQAFIKKELQATLFDRENNSRSGLLGVVLPSMYSKVYKGTNICSTCGGNHNIVVIDDSTVIKEFSANYYIKPHNKCSYSEEDRYAVLVKWNDFYSNPEEFIERAFNKRKTPTANRVTVYPK